MTQEKLLTDVELAPAIGSWCKPRTIKTLRVAGKIPYLKIGDRTIRYRLSSVLAALERLESKPVTTRRKGAMR